MVDRRRFLAAVAVPALSLSPLARAAAPIAEYLDRYYGKR
jgi:hypothetical protein